MNGVTVAGRTGHSDVDTTQDVATVVYRKKTISVESDATSWGCQHRIVQQSMQECKEEYQARMVEEERRRQMQELHHDRRFR